MTKNKWIKIWNKRSKISEKKFSLSDLIKINGFDNSVKDYNCPLWQKSSDKGIFGEEKYHIDHILELADGGTDSKDNLQALCLSCHTVKTSRNKSIRKNNIKKKVKIDLQTFLSKYKFARIHNNNTKLLLYYGTFYCPINFGMSDSGDILDEIETSKSYSRDISRPSIN